ncbi:MAG: FIST signal transduction protein [Candidatus Eiseniibacteriota bacterium]
MKWASALSLRMDTDRAAGECIEALRRSLDGSPPDVLFVFPSGDHAGRDGQLAAALHTAFPGALLVGCSAAGVIGGGHEAEDTTALSLTAAELPDVTLAPIRVEPADLPDLDESPSAWRDRIGAGDATAERSFVILADPFSSRIDELLQGLDYAYPGSPKVGGLASGSGQAFGNVLFLGERRFRDGAVGVALGGNVRMETIVSQGGRPVGPSFPITRCERNVLFQLDGRPALEVLQEVYENAVEDLPEGAHPAFFVGVRASEVGEGPGFLIRNILGVDPSCGAIAVGTLLRDGQVVRFHALSAESADEELRALLERYRDRAGAAAEGALLFSCNGRGQGLFGTPDHDSRLFHDVLRGDIALGGLFCAGEIGPVGTSTHVHGFTSSFGILARRR